MPASADPTLRPPPLPPPAAGTVRPREALGRKPRDPLGDEQSLPSASGGGGGGGSGRQGLPPPPGVGAAAFGGRREERARGAAARARACRTTGEA